MPQQSKEPVVVKIIDGDVITLDAGSSITLPVELRDAARDFVSRPRNWFEWLSRTIDVASITSDGVIMGLRPGGSRIIVRTPDGQSDSVLVWVQLPKGVPSGFRIRFVYADGVPIRWREELESAALHWESVIRGELSEVLLDTIQMTCPMPPNEPPIPPLTGLSRGVIIYVGLSGSYRPGITIEATGGPCIQRPLPHPMTILGMITINRAVNVDHINSETMNYVVHHEMGHALGLAALVQGLPPDWFSNITGVYKGELAREGYRREFGKSIDSIMFNGAHHWMFPRDVMSAIAPKTRITYVTIGALMDLGYPAAWYGATYY